MTKFLFSLCCVVALYIAYADAKAKAFVPSACLGKITVADFTKPCQPISDSLAKCDGVMIRFFCVSYEKDGK